MPRDGGDDCEKTVTIDAVTHEQVLTETSAILSRKRRWTVERNNYGLGHDEEQEVEHTSEQGTSKESEPAENHLNDFGSTPSSSRVYELFMSDSMGNEFFDLDIGPAADKENLENCTVMRVFYILLILTWQETLAKKRHYSSEEEQEATPSPGEKMVDRLAVNMAGAFVKSLFPEMERSEKKAADVRRAPISPLQAGLDSYSAQQVASDYNAIPQMSQQNPPNPFSYQGQIPQSYSGLSQQTIPSAGMFSNGPSQGAINLPSIPTMLTSGGGSPEALNAIRNQQYLAALARQQSEVAQYSSKQMEYLDQQRRYQQAMIDHQAGAALLMQKQQQEIINEQMKQLKSAYGLEENFTNDNTVGGRVLTARARGVKTQGPPESKHSYTDDDVLTNDEHLKQFFKDKYGISLDDTTNLTEDERQTLRDLRKQMTLNKEDTIEKGVFKTMDSLKNKVRPRPHSPQSSMEQQPREGSCPQCIVPDLKMMRGAWTQMYGNPKVIKKTFGTLVSLENMNVPEGRTTVRALKASCVGLEVGHSNRGTANLNLFYRDNAEGNELHEMHGNVSQVDNNVLIFDTEMYHTEMCLVKVGPSESDRYEFLIFSETNGKNACRSYHVFARNTDEFNRRHFDDVSEFMKNEVQMSLILPVGALPKASLCHLDQL